MREPAILSRRVAAAMPLVTLFGSAAAAVPALGGNDAELLDLGRRWLEIHVDHVAHWRAWQALPEPEAARRNDQLEAECEAMSVREWAIGDRIHAIQAKTIAGLAVKARIAAHDFDVEDIDIPSIERSIAATNDCQTHSALALALDVLKLARAIA